MQQQNPPNANGESPDPGNPTRGNPDFTERETVRTEIQAVVQQLQSRTEPISASEIVAAFAVLTIFAAVPASVLLAIVFEVYDITKDVQRCRKNDNGANKRYGTINCFPYTRLTSDVWAALGIALMAHYLGSRHTVAPQGSLRTSSEHVRSESHYPSVPQSAPTDHGHPDGIELDRTVAPTVPGSTVLTNRSAGDSGAEGPEVELQELDPSSYHMRGDDAVTLTADRSRERGSDDPFQDPPPYC